MKNLFIFLILIFFSLTGLCQKTKRFSFEINSGLNGNFFVNDYEEFNGNPNSQTYFFDKNFVGTVYGLQLSYQFKNLSSLFIAFAQSTNMRKANYWRNVQGVDVAIRDFRLRYIDQFYQIGFEKAFSEKMPNFKFNVGLVLCGTQEQTVRIENWDYYMIMDERNYRNSGLSEGGVFGGISIKKKIDTKFELGLKAKVFYLASVSTFEAITLTPTLNYNF